MTNGAYVYAVLVDGVRRYIGKGRGRRALMHMKEVRSITRRRAAGEIVRTTIFYNRLAKAWRNGAQIEIEIIVDGLSDREAFDREVAEISQTKQQLWNMLPGGRGGAAIGHQVSEEARAKLASSNKVTWSNPELVERQSEQKKVHWLRPEYRNQIESKVVNENAKHAISEKAKMRWANPEFREKMKQTFSDHFKNSERTHRGWVTRRAK
jgi:hypothetical protein